MSYTYLQEQGAESSAASFSDIPAFVLSRLNLTADESCSNDSATESCRTSRSGTTCGHSTGDLGTDESMSCAEGSRAQTSQSSGMVPELPVNSLGCGLRWPESYARYDRSTSSWKIHPCLFPEDSMSCSVTLPRWGTMRHGELLEHDTPGHPTDATASGFLLTPSGAKNRKNHIVGRLDEWGGSANPFRGTNLGSVRCAAFEEWMLGWPIMWTAQTPQDRAKYRAWLRSHGKSWEANDEANQP